MNRSTRIALTIVALNIVAVIVGSLAGRAFGAHDKPATCQTITKCRTSIAWNHSIVATLNARLAIADGRAPGGRAMPPCHRLFSCQLDQRQQEHARIWAEGAWRRLIVDNSPTGARRIVRYIFTTCGGAAKASEASQIVGWESGWQRYNINAAGDTSWWQFELPAHPDISTAEAEDAWWSTQRAERDSDCGENWSPEWSSVRDHGMAWD